MRLLQLLTISTLLLGFTACSGGSSTTASPSKSDSSATVNSANVAYNGKIAYIRMDSLMRGYGLYIDLADALGKKQQKVQAELTTKSRSLEREAMEYQEKAQKGLITGYQMKTTEEGLQKKQQDIMAYRDRVLNELGQEEAVMSSQISNAIQDYLTEYNAVKGYSMILQTMAGNPIMVADPALDITSEILVELNKRYEVTLTTKK